MKLLDAAYLDRIVKAVEEDNNMGFCVSCGHDQRGVEPDAREYECEFCGEFKVYGAEEILMGL